MNLKINSTVYRRLQYLQLNKHTKHQCKILKILRNENEGIDIVMEYAQSSIKTHLEMFKIFNLHLAKMLSRQILEGILELHKNNIVHGYLKQAFASGDGRIQQAQAGALG